MRETALRVVHGFGSANPNQVAPPRSTEKINNLPSILLQWQPPGLQAVRTARWEGGKEIEFLAGCRKDPNATGRRERGQVLIQSHSKIQPPQGHPESQSMFEPVWPQVTKR
jgi:hypothetical protein